MRPLSLSFVAIQHPIVFPSTEDQGEFFTYPPSEQDSVRELNDAMVRISRAKNPHQGAKSVAQPGREGWGASYLRAIYDEWELMHRDWRVLVNKRDFPEAREPALPKDFQAHIRAQFSSNQRKNAPAYRKIIRQWERWLTTGDPRYALPGYAECPLPGPRGRHPRGWSEKNMNRYAPPPAELAIARIGVHAGLCILPYIPGTRDGVRFLEWTSGDDVWLKRKAMVSGYGPCRVLQFGMMDYGASLYLDRFIQRPELPRKDGTAERLKRRDFLWCFALHMEHYGFPLDYKMHVICEHATATMSAAEARFVYEITEGQVIIGYNTMEGQMVHAWEERKSGNSKSKAWHESFHNLYANEEADIAGQVGADRDHTPAALMGRERHAIALDNAGMILRPEERARLRFPFPSLTECYRQSAERVGWINHRHDHECEGFETVMEWRPRGVRCLPLPEAELPRWLAANPRADIDTDVEWFPRPEKPVERAVRLSQGARFMRLPDSVWRRFYEDLHVSGEVGADGRLAFKCKQTDRKMWFEPADETQYLAPGTKVTGFYRPDGSAIHLFGGGSDRYLLSWPTVAKGGRADTAERQMAFSRKQTALNRALGNTRAATSEEVERAQADAMDNAVIFSGSGLIPEETTQFILGVTDELPATAAAVQAVTVEREGKAKASMKASAAAEKAAREVREAAAAKRAERARNLIPQD